MIVQLAAWVIVIWAVCWVLGVVLAIADRR